MTSSTTVDLTPPSTSCEAVSCNTPPPNSCQDSLTLLVYDAVGTCSDGACSYASRTESCAGGCANGACTANPCQGVTCHSPPANHCLDASTLVVPSATGTCSGGSCHYAETYSTCPFGCDQGACVNDPCIGRSCNTPPATFCLSASTLRTFQTAGTCSGGSCLYAPTDSVCVYGCVGGACANDPCAGKTCNTPPASACIDAATLRTFGMAGTCSGGSCLYGASDLTCAYGCVGGACNNDPCAGVVCNAPPAKSCLDANTLRSFVAPGSCAGGGCTYRPGDSTCVFGCAGGACNNDPCQGVSCNAPPAAACVGPTTLRTFSSTGSCNGGSCSYVPTDSSCGFGCSAGHCLGDPCQGVSCNTPPARACVAGKARIFSAPGTCGAAGTCSYGYTDLTCDNGCAGGYCNPPSCGAVTCNAPPASACSSASRLHTYFPEGSCASDTCNYVGYDVDCSQGCINGACIGGSWTFESSPYASTLDNGNGVLDADGEPVLVGCQGGSVRVRRRTRQGWKEETVDTGMGTCEARVALDAAGEPMVAYTDAVNADLRFAQRAGGTWAPKELVANAGSVGSGLSLAINAGVPTLSYTAPSAIRVATRASGGTWTEETIPSLTGYSTELRIDGGAPTVLVVGSLDVRIAKKSGGVWTVVATPTGQSSPEVLRQSFATGTTPSVLLKGQNVMSGYTNWSYRLIDGNGMALRSEDLGVDVPLALRSDGPPAFYTRRTNSSTGGSTPIIRARRNSAWEELANPVPLGSSFGTPVMYTGGGTRHVLVDTYAHRLSSPSSCIPQCSGRACGEDNCGGSCGSCASGFCAPTGVCASLQSSTMPGWAPSRSALGSGDVAHAVDTSYSSYVAQLYRSATGGVWLPGVALPQITVALGSTRVTVDSNDLARVILNGTISAQTGAFVATRDAGGTWSNELVSATQGGSLAIDASDTLYLVQCGTSSVTLRKKPAGGSWSAVSTIFTRPSGDTGMSCGYLAASSSGVLALPVSREYWVGSPTYDYRYERGVVTNESGTFQFVSVANYLTSYTVGDLVFDGAAAMHLLVGADYRVRPALGSFAVEALPAGFSVSSQRSLVTDPAGAIALGWTSGTGATQAVNLSRRGGPGTWTTDSAPTLAAATPGLAVSQTLDGLAFDGTGKAYLLMTEGDSYRSLVK